MFLENGGDHRQTLNRLRAHGFEPNDAVNRVFDRPRDQRLHFFGRESWSLSLNGNLGWCELRIHIVLGASENIGAIARQHACERHDYAAEPYGKSDNALEHYCWLSSPT